MIEAACGRPFDFGEGVLLVTPAAMKNLLSSPQ